MDYCLVCGKKRTKMEKRYNDTMCKKCREEIQGQNMKLNHPHGIGL